MMKCFYACPNGKQYLMELRRDHVVALLDLKSGYLNEFPFKTHKAAYSAFKEWESNSLPLLPMTFAIKTDLSKAQEPLREELALHDLVLPETTHLKNWIVFHGYKSMVLDDFDNTRIPEIDIVYLRRIRRKKRLQALSNQASKPNQGYAGLLEGVV